MAEPEQPRSTRESKEESERGFVFLRSGFARLTGLEKRIAALEVHEPSSLSADRNWTRLNPIPDQVVGLLGSATDHLRAIQVTVEDSGGKIMAMSLFTLLRSAYEATGTGLWLLHPSSRDSRVLRSVALTWDNRRAVRTVRTELGERSEDDEGFAYVERRVGEMLDAREKLTGLRIATKNDPEKGLVALENATTRLRSIEALTPGLTFPPLILWQMTSGIAHGNTAMMRNVLEQRQTGPFRSGSAPFELTTSVVLLAMFYNDALSMIEQLVGLYEQRNMPASMSV